MVKPERVFISIDMEGISSIVDWEEVGKDTKEYQFARKIMVQDLNAAIEGALDAGTKEIMVSDAHGRMRNLRPEDVHEAAVLMRGSPKPDSMMEGISEGHDAAMYVGYHSMKGTLKGICSHTISGSTVQRVWFNGRETGEFGMNSALAGYYGVPSVMLAGDYATTQEAEVFVPGITTATVKWANGRYGAKCLHPKNAAKLIRAKAKEALTKKFPEPRVVNEPVEIKLELTNAAMADLVMLIPGYERVDGVTVKAVHDEFPVALNALRAGIYLAGNILRR